MINPSTLAVLALLLIAALACTERPLGVERSTHSDVDRLLPTHLAVLACPLGTSGANCVSCEVYAQNGKCAESACATNGGWIGNLACDPFDCRHGYWWCTYPSESEDPGPAPYVYISCATSVSRGSTVSCEAWAELSPSEPVDFTVNSMRAIGRDSMLSFDQEFGHGETYTDGTRFTWEGVLAARTEVRLNITANGRDYSRTAVVAVSPRAWPAWTGQAPQVSYSTRPPMDTMLRVGTAAGLWDPFDTEPFLPVSLPVIVIDDGGPNHDVSYIETRPGDPSHRIYVHPDLLSGGRLSGLQSGSSPNCAPADVVAFRNRVEVHEGVTMHPTLSHWGVHSSALAAENPQRGLEVLLRFTGQGSSFTPPVNETAWARFESWLVAVKSRLQDPFDAMDYPLVNAHGCTMTFPA